MIIKVVGIFVGSSETSSFILNADVDSRLIGKYPQSFAVVDIKNPFTVDLWY